MVTDDTHIYDWIGRFFASPSRTIAEAVEVLSRKGYFDLSVLYKQLVEPFKESFRILRDLLHRILRI
jgi:hypothetical protein